MMEQIVSFVQGGFAVTATWIGVVALFGLLFILPARILQKRHGYSLHVFWSVAVALLLGALLIAVGGPVGLLIIATLVPLSLLWGLAISTPNQLLEIAS